MFRLDEVIQLKDDEHVRLVSKRHAVTILPSLVLSFFLIVFPFFVLFPLVQSGPAGIVLFLVLVVVGLILAWRTFAMWDGDVLVISNIRVVKVTQMGIFSRTVNELLVEHIQDTSWSKNGLFGTIWNYGTVHIGALKAIDAKYLPNPKDVHQLVQEIHELSKTRAKANVMDRTKRMERVKELVEDLSDIELLKIERQLRAPDRAAAIDMLFASQEEKVQAPLASVHAPVSSESTSLEADDDDEAEFGIEPKTETLEGADIEHEKEADHREIAIKKVFGSGGNGLKPLDE